MGVKKAFADHGAFSLHLYGVGPLVRTREPRADSGSLCLTWPPRRRSSGGLNARTLRHRSHRRAPRSACEREALVPLCGHLGARILIRHRPTDVAQYHPRLAGDVGADPPGVGLWNKRGVRRLLDACSPPRLTLRRRLDAHILVLAHVLEAIRD